MMRKNLLFTLVLSFVGLFVFAQADTSVYRLLAKDIQQKYAPDKRAIYVNLQIKGDSVWLESSSASILKEFEKLRPTNDLVKYIAVLLPSKGLNGLEYGVSNLSVSNNRANPQNAAELMTQMILGTPVKILKKQGGFYLVQTPDLYLSWTDGSAIKPMTKTEFEAWQAEEKVVFVADYGHAFASPNFNGMRVSDLVSGNILKLIGAKGKVFSNVAFPDGRLGYVETAKIKPYQDWVKKENPSAKEILATAKTLIGVPYLWGGTSVKGVDCSGFTKTAYFLNGVIIPRDASQQALVGQAVDVLENDSISIAKCLINLKAGDLLFFSAAKRRGINGGRVTHTAIYMGDGEFIQSAGMVKISSLLPTATNYDAAQSTTLVGARRILTEIGKPEITPVKEHDWYGRK